LRAQVEDARGAADDAAESPLIDLLLGDEVALLVAAAVADAHADTGLLGRADDPVGIGKSKRDRLLYQHGLAELERLEDWLDVRALAG